jgi:acetyltransferase-like isoleucine patch superfamily enzyme
MNFPFRHYTPSFQWLDEERGILVRAPTVIYNGCQIGDNFTTGHFVLIRENCCIGDNVSIGTHTEIGPGVVIGNSVRIHSNCFIPELTMIEDGAWIGPCVCICNDRYPGSRFKKEREGVTIKELAVIGANATILPGVTIGSYAFVGAGAVVTRNVPDEAMVVGNPAREI